MQTYDVCSKNVQIFYFWKTIHVINKNKLEIKVSSEVLLAKNMDPFSDAKLIKKITWKQ